MLWIVLMAASLVAGVFVNRSMTRWYARGLNQLKRREAQVTIALRRKKHEQEKVARTLAELRDTESSLSRLASSNDYAKHTDPGEWLLQNRHISLSLLLKAKKLAERREINVVDACVELGAIDTKLAREALASTCGAPVEMRAGTSHTARARAAEEAKGGGQPAGTSASPSAAKGPGSMSLNGRSTS